MTSGMGFAVAAPGSARPPSDAQPVKLPRLAHVWRREIGPGVSEAYQAVTEDGKWLFQLQGRKWAVGHLPTETELKGGFSSPRACRVYVASGDAQADLDRIQAEVKAAAPAAGGEG